jgi:hypothetical protein
MIADAQAIDRQQGEAAVQVDGSEQSRVPELRRAGGLRRRDLRTELYRRSWVCGQVAPRNLWRSLVRIDKLSMIARRPKSAQAMAMRARLLCSVVRRDEQFGRRAEAARYRRDGR